MTVVTTLVQSGPYTAVAQTTFAVTFQSISASEIEVLDGASVVSPAAYVFTRDPDGTGQVVMTTAFTGQLTIKSKPNFLQPTTFAKHGAFYPDLFNAPLDAATLRDLYLQSKIGTTVGPTGAAGAAGAAGINGTNGAAATVVVGTVTTLAAGASATVVNVGSTAAATFNFGLPTGPAGVTGATPNVTIGTVTTLSTGTAATASITGTTPNLVLNLGLPTGATGSGATVAWGGITGTLASQTDLNSALVAKAPIASPTFTGVPAADTAAAGTSTTQLATTAFVTTADNLKATIASPTFTGVPAAPTAVAGTSTTQLATTAFATAGLAAKADLAAPTFTGVPAAPTAVAGTNTTQLATTAFATTANALKADLASPALSGNPTAPTQAAGNSTTRLATTAFVDALKDLPLIRTVATPTLALTDRGGVVEITGATATIPDNATIAFGVGALCVFYNNTATAVTLSITTDTLRLTGSASTGARTIAPYGYAYCRKQATTVWTVSGNVT